jgi:cell fate (sporulation/competence/biofilm development) regulator YlbF (YheA/YmcA/DUF963 family)
MNRLTLQFYNNFDLIRSYSFETKVELEDNIVELKKDSKELQKIIKEVNKNFIISEQVKIPIAIWNFKTESLIDIVE